MANKMVTLEKEVERERERKRAADCSFEEERGINKKRRKADRTLFVTPETVARVLESRDKNVISYLVSADRGDPS